LETKINAINSSEHELEVNLGYDEIESEIDLAYKDEGKKIEMPGFRKGKVPLSMLKKVYGDAIEYKASEKIANKKFWEIADQQNLKPISTPKMVDLDFERGVKLFFKVQYEVFPELELKDYTNSEIQKFEWKVTEELVDNEIFTLRRRNAEEVGSEFVEDEYSVITVDLVRTNIDKNSSDEKKEGIVIDLTDQRVNSEIIQNAKGKKTGESFTFSFKDSREIEENGEKKTVDEEFNYEAVIKTIKKLTFPEMNDEFVQKITKDKFKTVDAWKDNIRKGIQSYYDNQSEEMYLNSLIGTVVKNNEFEPPHGYVHKLLDNMVAMEQEKAKREGNRLFNPKEAEHQLHTRAEWSAKWQIIKSAIAKKENITVDESDLKQIAEKEATETGISVDKLLKFYKDTNKEDLMLEEKVIEFLKKNNIVKVLNPDDLKSTTKETEEK
jgi:trigger factor